MPPQQRTPYSSKPVLTPVDKSESEKRSRNHDFTSTSMPSIDMHPQKTGDVSSSRMSVRGHQSRPYPSKSPASPMLSPIDASFTHGNHHHGFESHSPSGSPSYPRSPVSKNIPTLRHDEGTVRHLKSPQQEAADRVPDETARSPTHDESFDTREPGIRL